MKLMKFTHSCVRIENENEVLVIDPGVFSESERALNSVDYILITHSHADHFDAEKIISALEKNPKIIIYAPEEVFESVKNVKPDAKIYVPEVESSFRLGGFDIKTFGGQHALIYPLLRTIDNFGYVINEKVYHPGDSLIVPHNLKIQNVLAPIHAPWSKISEVIDFIIASGAEKFYPIHDGLINENGRKVIEGNIETFAKKYGREYCQLKTGDFVEL